MGMRDAWDRRPHHRAASLHEAHALAMLLLVHSSFSVEAQEQQGAAVGRTSARPIERVPGRSSRGVAALLRQARMQASMCSSSTLRSLVPAAIQGSSKARGPCTWASSRISMAADCLGDLHDSAWRQNCLAMRSLVRRAHTQRLT